MGKDDLDWSLPSKLKRPQSRTEGLWLCRIVPAFCYGRQSDFEYTQKSKIFIFLQQMAFQKVVWQLFAFVDIIRNYIFS